MTHACNPCDPKHRCRGFHCEHLDWRLLEQVIAVELDSAIRHAERETGRVVPDSVRMQWESDLSMVLKAKASADSAAHRFLPDRFQNALASEIKRFIALFSL